jgi:hypothetical protein
MASLMMLLLSPYGSACDFLDPDNSVKNDRRLCPFKDTAVWLAAA